MSRKPSLQVRQPDRQAAQERTATALTAAGVEELPETSFVCVGDLIDVDSQDGFLRGHGTQVVEGQLIASLCGVVQRVDKLVSVVPVHSRYTAEVGDVVVGRVIEIAAKRWRLDLNARREAALMLSAVNLPGGIQRRRTAEDELNMRAVYREGDLIGAEVQSLHADGSIALHTRSTKYGKLEGGQLVTVPTNIIKRQKQHFHSLEQLGVDMIIGCNGMIWITHFGSLQSSTDDPTHMRPELTLQDHDNISRASNAAADQGMIASRSMMDVPFLDMILAQEADRRLQATGQ